MADNLQWRNKHFVLFRYLTLEDAIQKGKYKLRPDLAEFSAPGISSKDYLYALIHAEKHKEACDFLAYVMHRRAAIWWGYRCLLTLQEELDKAPAVERDIANIGAPKPMPIPDWVQPKPPSPDVVATNTAKLEEAKAKFMQGIAKVQEIQKNISPRARSLWEQALAATNELIKKECGMTLEEIVQAAAKRSQEPMAIIDTSKIEEATQNLKAQIEAKRKETIDLIKSVIPPKMPDHEKKMRDDAMQAIYRWVVAPDEVNSQAAQDVGNACPDQPAGLMAMAAFWSYGDLAPMGKMIVPTPSGLAANGICASLLQAGLAKGGFRKYKERCELYMNLGLKVAWGEDNWGESLTEKEAPHQQEAPVSPAAPAAPASAPSPAPAPEQSQQAPKPAVNTYQKWMPGMK